MASKAIFGSDGAVAITGHYAVFSSWSIEVRQTVTRVAGYGETWSRKKGGVKDATGTVGGFLKFDDTTNTPGLSVIAAAGVAAGAFTLTAATGCTYTATTPVTVIIASAGINHQFEGDCTVTYNYEYNGAVTETWDETA